MVVSRWKLSITALNLNSAVYCLRLFVMCSYLLSSLTVYFIRYVTEDARKNFESDAHFPLFIWEDHIYRFAGSHYPLASYYPFRAAILSVNYHLALFQFAEILICKSYRLV